MPEESHNWRHGTARLATIMHVIATAEAANGITMKVFVPLTDHMLDAMPDDWDADDLPVPYRIGMIPLGSLERAADPPAPGLDAPLQSMSSCRTSPGSTPSSSALPAFSSSTYRAGPSLG